MYATSQTEHPTNVELFHKPLESLISTVKKQSKIKIHSSAHKPLVMDEIKNIMDNASENIDSLESTETVLTKDAQLKKFKAKEICYYNKINKFYKNCDASKVTKMVDIINGNSNISLRILDWFVTRYSNRKKIIINIDDEMIDIHISYKAQLKSYKKKYFDPFKRRTKFEYTFKNIQKSICTTLGQLNFFKWSIENNIVEYVEKNYNDITHEMNISNKNDKKRKKDKSIEQLVIPHEKYVNKNNIVGINVTKQIIPEQDFKIILTFD